MHVTSETVVTPYMWRVQNTIGKNAIYDETIKRKDIEDQKKII